MSDNNVDVMGGESVQVNEVNDQPEAVQDQAQDSVQENKVPESVPYDRFSSVNAEKNELKQKLEQANALNQQLSQNMNQYLESQNTQATQEPEMPETVEDVMSFINKEIDNRVKPIEEQRLRENITNNVNNYFSQDKEAAAVKDQMDQYYDNLPSYRQQAILDSVSRGDVSVLNEIKHTVALQHNTNLKNMATESANNEANKTLTPGANKIVRETAPGMNDLISEGKKTGNFDNFFSQFVNQAGLS